MSVSYAPTKLRVPLGFEHLLEALAREVLREQPKDIINFAAEYFRRKLILRDEGTLDGIITASEKSATTTKSEDVQSKQAQPSVEQDVASTEEPEAVDIDLSDPEVQKAASAIQARFRSHLKKGEAKKNQEEAQPEAVDDKEMLEQTKDELFHLDLDDPELNKAASVIQSNFRTYLSEKNKTTEDTETQKESEGAGDTDTGPATLRDTEDPDSVIAESTTDKITTETEESNIDEQIPPAPAEAQEETEHKEESSIPEPSSSELESQEKVEKEEDSKEALPPEPVASDEEPQPAETGEEGAAASKEEEEEPQVEVGDESKELPGTVEETKGSKSDGDDGTSSGGGDIGSTSDGDGVDGEPADKDTAAATSTEQVEATAGDGEKQEEEGGESAGDPKEEPSDEAS